MLLTASLGLGQAAMIQQPPAPDQLVEGHTVFVVIEQITKTTTKPPRFAAAVAVLVREAINENFKARWPGVLWFNDQYLVDPDSTSFKGLRLRYPCSGAVLAVNEGDPFPTDGPWPSNTGAAYVESYHITDPNDHAWDIDKWTVTAPLHSYPLWTVALGSGGDSAGEKPDDGWSSCRPYEDACPVVGLAPSRDPLGALGPSTPPIPSTTQINDACGPPKGIPNGTLDLFASDPGTNGYHYPCGKPDPCARILYNAVLFMKLNDLVIADVPKDHHKTAPDRLDDVSGCQESAIGDYPCPSGDDDREGNSHPFRPPNPSRTTGNGNHGSSDPGKTPLVHATRNVDIAYGITHPPIVRVFDSRYFDTEGSAAPYDAN